jgi:hypothetical protein
MGVMGELRELQDAVMHAAPGIDAYIAASRLSGFQAGYKAGLSEACKMLDETLLLENPHNVSAVAFKQALQQLIQSGA